ncbi:phosphonatase-like hydrolase [Parasediminibacterium paludis]|uniref:Phosphonatase-like hydrolase n=1 Tax=Parasediminibacterium paludis TaxID=908966 RepID=A0ABV8PTZ3_9BACT
MIQMVVFDMAGTTVDEDNVVYKTLHTAINEAGVDVTFEDVLLHGAGKEKYKAIKDILLSYGVVSVETTDDAFNYFLSHLANAYNTLPIKPQFGAEKLFATLHQMGIKVVLNTGYNRATAELILQKLGWQIGKDIDSLVTASDVPNNRPMPDMIKLAMQQFGITDAKEVVKVGDSTIDIEEGQNAGCGLAIGITTGAHNVAQLQSAKPDFIINDLMALLPLLQSANN